MLSLTRGIVLIMTDAEQDQNRENLALVLSLSRSYQRFFRSMVPVFAHAGLTPSQWDALEVLHSKGPLSVNELIESLIGSSGNVDVIVKNLISAGLVHKTVDREDRRRRILSLTSKGKTAVAEFYPVHNQALATVFARLTRVEKRKHVEALSRLRKQIMPATQAGTQTN